MDEAPPREVRKRSMSAFAGGASTTGQMVRYAHRQASVDSVGKEPRLIDSVLSKLPDLPRDLIHEYIQSCPYSVVMRHDTLSFESYGDSDRLVSVVSDAGPATASAAQQRNNRICVDAVYLPLNRLARVMMSVVVMSDRAENRRYRIEVLVMGSREENRVVDSVTFDVQPHRDHPDDRDVGFPKVKALLPKPDGFLLVLCITTGIIALVDLDPAKGKLPASDRVRLFDIKDPRSVRHSMDSNLASGRPMSTLCEIAMGRFPDHRARWPDPNYTTLRSSHVPCIGFCESHNYKQEDRDYADMLCMFSIRVDDFETVPVVTCEFAILWRYFDVEHHDFPEPRLASPQEEREFLMQVRQPSHVPLPLARVQHHKHVTLLHNVAERICGTQDAVDTSLERPAPLLWELQYMESLNLLIVHVNFGMLLCRVDEPTQCTFVKCTFLQPSVMMFTDKSAQLPGNSTTRLYQERQWTAMQIGDRNVDFVRHMYYVATYLVVSDTELWVVMKRIFPQRRPPAEMTFAALSNYTSFYIPKMQYVDCTRSLLFTCTRRRGKTLEMKTIHIHPMDGPFGKMRSCCKSMRMSQLNPLGYVNTVLGARTTTFWTPLVTVSVNIPERHSFQGFKTNADVQDVRLLLNDRSVRAKGHMLMRPATRETTICTPEVTVGSGNIQQVQFSVPDVSLPVYVVLRDQDTQTFVYHVLFPTEEDEARISAASVASVAAAAASGALEGNAGGARGEAGVDALSLEVLGPHAKRSRTYTKRNAGAKAVTGPGGGGSGAGGVHTRMVVSTAHMSVPDLVARAKELQSRARLADLEERDHMEMEQIISELRSRFDERGILRMRRLRSQRTSFLYDHRGWDDDDETLLSILL